MSPFLTVSFWIFETLEKLLEKVSQHDVGPLDTARVLGEAMLRNGRISCLLPYTQEVTFLFSASLY